MKKSLPRTPGFLMRNEHPLLDPKKGIKRGLLQNAPSYKVHKHLELLRKKLAWIMLLKK
jgi:hypothetical protein